MADKDYSLKAFNEFLDYLSSKHLLNKNTAQSRKAAANKVLGVLGQDEVADLRALDVDMAFKRFENKEGKTYKPESLMVYRSRLGSALSDFFSYVESPAQFKPSVKGAGSTSGKKAQKTAKRMSGSKTDSAVAMPAQPLKLGTKEVDSLSVPVPLREGVTVKIVGLPTDLTEAEASRLAAIVKAYAVL